MAIRDIANFPEKSEIAGSDLFLVQAQNSSQGSKMTFDTIKDPLVDKGGYDSKLYAGYAGQLIGEGASALRKFGWRQTPSTNICRVDSIVGRTVIWNQLIQNGNFSSSDGWTATGCSIVVQDNKCTATVLASRESGVFVSTTITTVVGHKYLVACEFTPAKDIDTNCPQIGFAGYSSEETSYSASNKKRVSVVVEAQSTSSIVQFGSLPSADPWLEADTFVLENFVCHDLTLMRDSSESLVDFVNEGFSLNYYPYCVKKLVDFNINAITACGPNLWNGSFARVISGNEYRVSGTYTAVYFAYTVDGTQEQVNAPLGVFTAPGTGYIFLTGASSSIRIRLNSLAGVDDYVSFTRDIKLVNFDGGLKSVNGVYDEKTPLYEIVRIGSRDYIPADDSDPSVVTDGVSTYYVLATPITYEVRCNLIYNRIESGVESPIVYIESVESLVDSLGRPVSSAGYVANIFYSIDYISSVDGLIATVGTAITAEQIDSLFE